MFNNSYAPFGIVHEPRYYKPSGKRPIVIDTPAYRDYFPSFKVGVKDESTGLFFELQSDEVYEAAFSEFHDVFARTTAFNFDRSRVGPRDKMDEVMWCKKAWPSFKGRYLAELEFEIDLDCPIPGFASWSKIKDEASGKERERTDDEKVAVIAPLFLEKCAEARKKQAADDAELAAAIAKNTEIINRIRAKPGYAQTVARQQPGVYYGEVGTTGGGVVSKEKGESVASGTGYGL